MPTKFSKIQQLIDLLEKHPQGLHHKDIARHLKIDQRTVRRYLNELRQSGYVITDLRESANKPSKITISDLRKPPKSLASNLKKIKNDLGSWGNPKYIGVIDQAIEYLKTLSNYKLYQSYVPADTSDMKPDIYHIDHGPLAQGKVQSSLLKKIETAVGEHTVLSISYSSYRGTRENFDFFPYVVSLRVGTLYLIGRRVKNRGPYLSLSVKRIKRCIATSRKFSPESFDPEEYYKYCFGQFPRQPYERPSLARLRINEKWVGKFLQETRFNPSGKIIKEKGMEYFEVEVMLKPDFINWVLSLYPFITPEKPRQLVTQIKNRISN